MSEEKEKHKRGFILIQPWMVDLGLSSNELLIFAVINGFSMDGKSTFNGGLQYLCDLTGINRRTAIRCLSNLIEQGLVKKSCHFDADKNITFSQYAVVDNQCKNDTSDKMTLVTKRHGGSDKMSPGVVTKCHGGSDKMSPIKEIRSKNKINKKENNNPLYPPKDSSQKNLSGYSPGWLTAEGVEQEIAEAFVAVRKAKKAPMTKLAVDALKREAHKAGITLSEAVQFAAESGYQSFKACYIRDSTTSKSNKNGFGSWASLNADLDRRNEKVINDEYLLPMY